LIHEAIMVARLPGGARREADHWFSPLHFLADIERDATEAYRHALDKTLVPRHPDALFRLLGEHAEAELRLRRYLPREEIELTQPTPWTSLTSVIDSAARFHAPLAALWSIRDAEAKSARDYEECLNCDDLPEPCKKFVRSILLPRTHGHMMELDELIEIICEEVDLLR
jgi:hypothetical protein